MKRDGLYIICILILAFLLYRSCSKDPITRIDQKKVDSLNNAVALRDIKYSHDSASWEQNARQQDSIIADLTEGKAQQLEAAKAQIVQLTFQRNKFRTALEGRDTVGQLTSCKEFMLLADSFYTKAVMYEVTIDSLIKAQTSQHESDTATIRRLMEDRLNSQSQINALQHFLADSLKDNADLRQALTRSKRGRWLIIALSAVAGGFLGHSIK